MLAHLSITAPPASALPAETYTVTREQPAVLVGSKGSKTTLRLIAVRSDERCPSEVACYWAKPPIITVELQNGLGRITAEIIVGPAAGPVLVGGWSIKGVDLLPKPVKADDFGKVKPLEEYSVVLTATH